MNNEIKEILDKCTPFLFGDEVDKLTDYITNLQQKVEQYENPDDLTLFYMWLDTKAKDKMKQLENEVMMLRQQNTMITTLGEDYKSRCEKATEYITSYEAISTIQGLDKIEENKILDERTINVMTERYLQVHHKLLNILGDDKSEY